MSTEELEQPIVQMLSIITWKGPCLAEANRRAGFSVGIAAEVLGALNGEVLLRLMRV